MGVISVLTKLPLWVWLCAALAVWGATGQFRASNLQRQIDKTQLELAQAVATAEAKARQEEQQKLQANAKVVNDLYKRTSKAEADRVVLNQQLNRLQQQLKTTADAASEDTATFCGNYEERTKLYGKLLSECSAVAVEGANRVRQLGSKITALQDYATGVCLSANN